MQTSEGKMKNSRQLELSKLAPRPRWSVVEGEAETNREREEEGDGEGFIARFLFCAKTWKWRTSWERVKLAKQANPPPPPPPTPPLPPTPTPQPTWPKHSDAQQHHHTHTHTHTRDLTPGRTAAKPADVYVTAFLPTACRNVQAHTLTNTDTHTGRTSCLNVSRCSALLRTHTLIHTHLRHETPTHIQTHIVRPFRSPPAPVSPPKLVSAAAGLMACCEAGPYAVFARAEQTRHVRAAEPRGCFFKKIFFLAWVPALHTKSALGERQVACCSVLGPVANIFFSCIMKQSRGKGEEREEGRFNYF